MPVPSGIAISGHWVILSGHRPRLAGGAHDGSGAQRRTHAFRRCGARCALDAQRLLREAGCRHACWTNPNSRCRPAPWAGCSNSPPRRPANRRSVCAWRACAAFPISAAGPDCARPAHAGSALEALVQHIHLHNEALAVRVVPGRPGADPARTRGLRRKAATAGERTLAGRDLPAAHHLSRRRLETAPGLFRHKSPRDAPQRQFFGTAVAFGQAFDGIVCDARDLRGAQPGAPTR